MRLVYSPDYVVELGAHSFATIKFAMAAQRLLAAGLVRPAEVLDPGPAPRELLLRAHDAEWVDRVLEGRMTLDDEMRVELPGTPQVVLAHRKHAAGTLLACRHALETGVGLHAGGGSHHAFAGRGEGFCLFNDLAIAVLELLAAGEIASAAVVDLDAHHGNGTAAILRGRRDAWTFSIHQEGIYPFDGTSEAPPGTFDAAVPAGTGDAEYRRLLQGSLPAFLDERKPGLVVYQAGVDVWEGDLLGGLALTPDGIAERDRIVLEECRRRRIPAAVTLGGGYARDAEAVARLHAGTLRAAIELFS